MYSKCLLICLWTPHWTLFIEHLTEDSDSLTFVKSVEFFSFIEPRTLCLLPISIVGASAGTIRAVPDTVLKVPGLAPVLIFKFSKKLQFRVSCESHRNPNVLQKHFMNVPFCEQSSIEEHFYNISTSNGATPDEPYIRCSLLESERYWAKMLWLRTSQSTFGVANLFRNTEI